MTRYALTWLTIGLSSILNVFPLQSALNQQCLEDLEVARLALQVHYAPLEWKTTYSGWDMQDQTQKVIHKVQSGDSELKTFQKALTHFFYSLNDHHTKVFYYSTAIAYLPFAIEQADGRVFVRSIDDRFAKSIEPPLKVGDEVVNWGGLEIHDVMNSFKSHHFGEICTPTHDALALRYLPFRIGSLGHPMPKEASVSLKVKRNGVQGKINIQVTWNKLDEKILPPTLQPAALGLPTDCLNRQMVWSDSQIIAEAAKELCLLSEEENGLSYHAESNTKSFRELPDLGKVLWKSSSSSIFKANIFLGPKGQKIGFVRLPNYLQDNYEQYAKATSEFASLMKKFNKETSALVIDQRDNDGGSLFFLYSIASCIMDRPFQPPLHRMSITQAEVAEMLNLEEGLRPIKSTRDANDSFGKTIEGYPVDFTLITQLRNYTSNILNAWASGEYLTNPMPLLGVDKIQPNPNGHYTRPVLFLIDELDFSCADFMPAILQDNSRAVIFGKQTAGAGGFVSYHTFPNRSGILAMSYTASIASRKDGTPIETIGVIPDTAYELTVDDLTGNYKDYKKALLERLEQML